MDYEPTASDKRDALLREFSNVGYGMQDPIDLQTLDGIIRQKSVVFAQLGCQVQPRYHERALQENPKEPRWHNYP